MREGDTVALVADLRWTCTITKIRGDVADVDFDGKGTGRIRMSDLQDADLGQDDEHGSRPTQDESDAREDAQRERARATGDKGWPPSNLQHKVPRPDGAK